MHFFNCSKIEIFKRNEQWLHILQKIFFIYIRYIINILFYYHDYNFTYYLLLMI